MFEVVKIIKKGDYEYCVTEPRHPTATKHGYVLHHRIIVENSLGRLLNKDEVVHHINENKKDNRLENLSVMLISEHNRYHKSLGNLTAILKCPFCESYFTRVLNRTYYSDNCKRTFCSRRCNGKASTIKRNYIENNICCIFNENHAPVV